MAVVSAATRARVAARYRRRHILVVRGGLADGIVVEITRARSSATAISAQGSRVGRFRQRVGRINRSGAAGGDVVGVHVGDKGAATACSTRHAGGGSGDERARCQK